MCRSAGPAHAAVRRLRCKYPGERREISTVKGTTELLPLARGDADILRTAVSKIAPAMDWRHENVEALLKRLEDGMIGIDGLAVLRQLVEKERTVRSLILRQHAPGPDPDPGAPALDTLEALRAKLDRSAPSN